MKKLILSISLAIISSAVFAGNGPSVPGRSEPTRPEPKWESGGAIRVPDFSRNTTGWDKK